MTEPDFLQRTRNGYDLTAAMYAEHFHGHLHDKPLDRAMLAGFAGLVERNPGLDFQMGSMTGLDFDDEHFHGICAWYSVIHIPDELLPDVFSEFRRVLRPGGWALLAFQVGEHPRELNEAFGEQVTLTFYRRQPDTVAQLLDDAGLRPYAGLVREPNDDGFESTPHAYLIAQK